jgi:hypothetical protein
MLFLHRRRALVLGAIVALFTRLARFTLLLALRLPPGAGPVLAGCAPGFAASEIPGSRLALTVAAGAALALGAPAPAPPCASAPPSLPPSPCMLSAT